MPYYRCHEVNLARFSSALSRLTLAPKYVNVNFASRVTILNIFTSYSQNVTGKKKQCPQPSRSKSESFTAPSIFHTIRYAPNIAPDPRHPSPSLLSPMPRPSQTLGARSIAMPNPTSLLRSPIPPPLLLSSLSHTDSANPRPSLMPTPLTDSKGLSLPASTYSQE